MRWTEYLFRGVQFSEAGLNGALMKRKNSRKNKHKKIGTTKYGKSIEGSIWLGSKVPF